MRPFKYTRAADIGTAMLAASANKDAKYIAGGTNILDRSAPFAAGAFNDFYDVKTHSSRGRFLYTQITKQF